MDEGGGLTAVFACLFAGTVFAADSEDLSSCVVDGNQIKITGTAVHTEDEGREKPARRRRRRTTENIICLI